MFDRIAPTYDCLNRVISFGRDKSWRRKVAARLRSAGADAVLDAGTGTGDQIFALFDEGISPRLAIGMDPSWAMLSRARGRARVAGLGSRIDWVRGERVGAVFRGETFDAVTMAFSIRNMPDIEPVLGDVLQVLKPGGRLVILEAGRPGGTFARVCHLIYMRYVMPALAGLLAHEPGAYRYLAGSVERFPSPEKFSALMVSAGFVRVSAEPVAFGAAVVFSGRKPMTPARAGID